MVVLITGDLMMASTARSHAGQQQTELKQIATVDGAMDLIREHRPHLLLIDLQTPGLDPAELAGQLRELSDSAAPLTIAYAQHVEVDRLEQARAAGFDHVLTRGQINAQMGKIIGGAR